MGTSEVEALKTVLVYNNQWAELCTICVFVGLIVEYTILLWLKRKSFSPLELTLTILAGIAIAGGVFGEYHFGKVASNAAIELGDISGKQVLVLEKEAALLKKQAEDERLKRVEIEERVAWRRLTKQQQITIGSRLRSFSGETGNLSFVGGDTEGFTFALDIASAFRMAQWKVKGPGVFFFGGPFPPPPAGVFVGSSGDLPSVHASAFLARELRSFGFNCTKEPPGPPPSGPPSYPFVSVKIGPRPEGPQGEANLRQRNKRR